MEGSTVTVDSGICPQQLEEDTLPTHLTERPLPMGDPVDAPDLVTHRQPLLARRQASRQRGPVLVVAALVVALDQAVKWWAWRHVPGTIINPGGDPLVSGFVGQLYANPVAGALLDLLDVGVLGFAASRLVRRRRHPVVLLSAAVVIGGWSSNVLDRLGLHYWTAPGSVRGAVDFVRIGRDAYNLADLFISAGTMVLLAMLGVLAAREHDLVRRCKALARSPLRARIVAVAPALGLIAVVTFGAAHYGTMTTPHQAPVLAPPPTLQVQDPALAEQW